MFSTPFPWSELPVAATGPRQSRTQSPASSTVDPSPSSSNPRPWGTQDPSPPPQYSAIRPALLDLGCPRVEALAAAKAPGAAVAPADWSVDIGLLRFPAGFPEARRPSVEALAAAVARVAASPNPNPNPAADAARGASDEDDEDDLE